MLDRELLKEKVELSRDIINVAYGKKKAQLVFKNATYVNVFSNKLTTEDIAVQNGIVAGMGEYSGETEIDLSGKILCPGFLDAHIHIESSLLSPYQFAKSVIPHGTTTIIADPHEIANVMGRDGIRYMLEATEGLGLDVYFMLPSCVPATKFDESGAVLEYEDIADLLENDRVRGLGEVMDFYGVMNGDPGLLKKIIATRVAHKKIDGHAPGVVGKEFNAYTAAGVYSDHECSTAEEALWKLEHGMYIMVREGTAAKNLNALLPLLTPQYESRLMFASDDKHPNDILDVGHVDEIVKRAIKAGVDPIIAVKMASYNACTYYQFNNRGAVSPGFLADFTIIDNFDDFNIELVYKRGKLVFDGKGVLNNPKPEINQALLRKASDTFKVKKLSESDFTTDKELGLIGMVPQQIITTDLGKASGIDLKNDILKIAVIERHSFTGHIGLGYIKGYGLKKGAVATSITHDSHNIIVVGADERSMAMAVNKLIDVKGGIVVYDGSEFTVLPLELGGLMTDSPIEEVNSELENVKKVAYGLGIDKGNDPFMTLSFMALTVIPTLRITTLGVFDVGKQGYVE